MADTREYLGHDRASRPLDDDKSSLVAAARGVAEPIERRLSRRPGAPVRAGFVSVHPSTVVGRSTPTPALARLLRGGRGGEVKLKLLLSVLWIAASPPYDAKMPGRVWAELIGLPDPGGRGTHRISAATRQLNKQNFVSTRSRPGEPTEIVLLNETGSGEAYTSPGQRVAQLARAEEDFERDRYFRVPKEFWTNGWVAVLDGPAVAMLLVLLSLAAGRSDDGLWIAPEVADRRFHLSGETRKKGFDRLHEVGLIDVHRRPVTHQLDSTRHRNVYTLKREVLTEAVPKKAGRSGEPLDLANAKDS